MRVMLLHPPLTMALPPYYKRPPLYEPLGLAYLAAALREAGHEPLILDILAEDWRVTRPDGDLTRVGMREEDVAARIAAFAPELIGITCQFSGFARDCLRTAAVARRAAPDAPIVFGGADATARAEELASAPNIDMVVRGEGERVLLDIVEAFERTGQLPRDLPGTVAEGQVNPPADYIEDPDTIPFPARDLLKTEIYMEDQTVLMPYAKRKPIGFLISSRGCPYNCVFCSTKKVWRTFRARSAGNVVDEIEHLVNEYGVREIVFQDDSFLAEPSRVVKISNEVVRRNLDIAWTVPPGLSAWLVNEEVIRAMHASGFYRACFPIESGDPKIIQFIRKPVRLDRVLETVDMCNRLGVWTYGNFIIGFPEQTAESIEMTAEFILKCNLDMVSIFISQPYAGSELYDIYEQMGLLGDSATDASTIFNTRFGSKYFTADELQAKRDDIYRRFTRHRIRRCFTTTGLNDLRRKMNTPERFAYGWRVFGRYALNSLKARKVGMSF